MPPLDSFGQAYLRLTLEINKHVDGYVDAYTGPPEIKAEVEAAGKKSPADLLNDLAWLKDNIPPFDAARRAYLAAVLRAMECTLRMANGETFDYLDEVSRLYDIAPEKVDESVFRSAHAQLDALLPGSGDLVDRLESWRRQYDLPADQLMPALEMARAETCLRTQQLVDLVKGEGIEFTLTSHQPWSAYNWFKGNAHSLIEFNTDIPVNALNVIDLFAHEGYPGHHTEHQLKEKHLYKDKGYAEFASALLHSPSAVIAEGIATTAIEIIFPHDTSFEWTAEVLIPAAGLPRVEADLLRRISRARDTSRSVSCNAAFLYHRGEINDQQTVDYIRAYALAGETRAKQSFDFITNPLFRSYVFTYTGGYRLLEKSSLNGDKRPLFLRLLKEEVLPSQLT